MNDSRRRGGADAASGPDAEARAAPGPPVDERYDAILESLEDGYYEVDAEGRLLLFNSALCRMLGYGRAQMAGMSFRRFTDPESAERLYDVFHRVWQTGEPERNLEWPVFRSDGSRGHAQASVTLMRDAQGHRAGFRGVARDVTEQRRAEQALRESEERHRRLVELSPEAIAIHCDGRLVFINSAGLRLVGARTPEQVVGRPALDFVHPDSRELAAQRMRALTALTGEAPLAEERFLRLDGTTLDVEVAGMPFAWEGRPAALVVLRDVSGRRRAERLQSALYRIAELTSGAENMDEFYAAIHGIVGELMYAGNFYIALHDPETDSLSFPYWVDEVDPRPEPMRLGKTLTGHVLRSGEPLFCPPAVFEAMLRRDEIELVGEPSVDWLGVPLKRGGQAFGVLVVQSYNEGIRFSEADRDLLTFVSQHVATAFDRKQASDALRESEAKFRTLAETAPCAIFIYQGSGFRYANQSMAAISGYSREELLGMNFWDLVHPDFRQLVQERGLARQRGEAVPQNYEFQFLRKDGAARWVDFCAGAIQFGGQPAALGTAFDITERKAAEERIRDIAYKDALTGLPNRRLFGDRLQMAVAQGHRLGQRIAVLFLDLDRFKVINDSLGHSVGDELLQAVAQRLRDCVREGDTVARLGGDEFILLLPGIGRALDAAKVAGKLLESLREPFRLGGRELFVTASLGISLYPDDGSDPESLIKNADTAMYRAKEQGRDNYQLYTPAMNASAVERLALENSLRRALAQNELLLHYQPLLDVATGRVHAVEALLRWRHPEHGFVAPGDFIPLAEVTGLILPIGPWVLRSACAQVKAWHDAGLSQVCVAVNLSARQFQQADLPELVTRILEETGLAPRFLDLEITESSAMQSAEATVQVLRQLKALGVRVSIDDFGTGYSSLSYLKRLPIDTLKIDKSFVRDIGSDPDDAAIVTAVIAMARTLKLTVVAEGVENEEQLAFLAGHGCDRMQGYVFSPPLAPEECEELLRRHRR